MVKHVPIESKPYEMENFIQNRKEEDPDKDDGELDKPKIQSMATVIFRITES